MHHPEGVTAEEASSPSPEDAAERAERDYRFAASACVADEGGYVGGMSLFSMTTILPLFVRQLTDSRILVGLIPALYAAGVLLPQLPAARVISHLPRLLRWVMVVGFLERLFLLLLAPLTLWLWRQPGALLGAFFVVWTGFAVTTGLNYVAYYSMIAKIIPAQQRGRLFGIGGAIGGVLGVLGARLAEHLLQSGGMPHGYAWCFTAGSVILLASFIPLGFAREPKGEPPAERPHASPRQISMLLRADPAFARFVFSNVCYALAGAAPAFYTAYALDELGATAVDVARFTAVLTGVTVAAYPLWGIIGDAGGYRRVLVAAAGLFCATIALALAAPTLSSFYLVFALHAAASAGAGLATGNMILEFGSTAQAPVYLAVNCSCAMPIMALAPALGGGLAEALGYRAVFVVAALAAGASAAGWLSMAEPRGRHAT